MSPDCALLMLLRFSHLFHGWYYERQRGANVKQVCPSSGTDVYPHMPILRPHTARFRERHISSVTFTSVHLYGNVYIGVGVARTLFDLSNFGLLGEQR